MTDRVRLPYGRWTCADGREVLFNRGYEPIWQRSPGAPARPADPQERIAVEREEWFFNDANPPWQNAVTRRRCTDVLKSWGVA